MNFIPHGMCFLWTPVLLQLLIATNGLIGMSYLIISIIVMRSRETARKLVPHTSILVYFSSFIFLCGVSHLMDVVVIYFPKYWIQAWLLTGTSLAAIGTLYSLPRATKQILRVIEVYLHYEERCLSLETEYRGKLHEIENKYDDYYARVEEINDLLSEVIEPGSGRTLKELLNVPDTTSITLDPP